MAECSITVAKADCSYFTQAEIDEFVAIVGRQPDSQEDPEYVNGVRCPRALEWDFETAAAMEEIAMALEKKAPDYDVATDIWDE